MYDVMRGVRVVEVAEMLMGPATSMILADWGAEVIKVERTGSGDLARAMSVLQSESGWNYNFEVANRGKKSIGIDLSSAKGREVLAKLVQGADVFLTNIRARAQKKMGIRAEDILSINPRIIYAWGSGYGPVGPMSEKPGFDWATTWCHAGISNAQIPPGGEPPYQPASVGDLITPLGTAGAIAAALFRRERTGKGCVVTSSLYHTGIYIMTQSITLAGSQGAGKSERPLYPRRDTPFMALACAYRTKDDRWIALCLLFEAYWPDFCRHIGKEDFLTDARFATVQGRDENKKALIDEIQRVFEKKTFAEWKAILSTLEGVWAPLASAYEVLEEEQALVNGYVIPVTRKDGTTYLSASTPLQFDEHPIGPLNAAPDFAEHTNEVLQELGYEESTITALREAGPIA
jgi:formyl-CoA transferase